MKYFNRTRIFGLLTGGLTALYLYACWIEPIWLEVTEHSVPARVHRPLTLAHVSDLHTRRFGRIEQKMLAALRERKPDLIVISGDSTIDKRTFSQMREVLSRLQAPLGVWAVRGNWENSVRIPRERQFFQDLGIHFLLNDAAAVRDDVWIAGFDDGQRGKPIIGPTLDKIPPSVFRIGLFHAPGLFNDMAGRIDLGLAGHTHGGQLRLPFLPALYLPPGSAGYVEGWYEREGSNMYVSRGIGMSVLEARLLARPELAFITLQPN